MTVDSTVLLTIVAMAAATYSTRLAGMWLTGRLALTGRARAWLNALPGAVIVSLVTPTIVGGGPADALAAMATAAIAYRTGNILPAMLGGVVIVWLLRGVLG